VGYTRRMKLTLERTLVGILLVIAAGIVIHAPLTVWLGTVWPDYVQYIKAWKELLMGVALVLLVVAASRQKKINALLNDRVVQLALAYAGLHFVMLSVFQNGLEMAGAGLLIDLRYILYFVLVYGTIKLFPKYRQTFIKAFVAGAVVVLGFALLQMFVLPRGFLANIGYGKDTIAPYLLVDEDPSYVRISSTLRGPNPLGAYTVIVLGLALAYAIRRRLRVKDWWALGLVGLSAGLALGSSYSRSSLIGAFLALIVALVISVPIKARKQIWISLALVLVGVVAILFALRGSTFISNVVLHDNPATGAFTNSNDGHLQSVIDGMASAIGHPLGAGVGSTGSASLSGDQPVIIENQYLFLLHEVGWIGFALFVWLFVEVLRRLWKLRGSALALGVFASGIGLAVIGLLLPVWVDDTVSIVWWGLAALVIAGTVKERSHGARTSK
jgi:hypothetical protein